MVKSFQNASGVYTILKGIDLNIRAGEFVAIIGKSKAVRMPVETGIKNDTAIEVKKGLEADSLVIVNVPDSLRDQQKIIIVP